MGYNMEGKRGEYEDRLYRISIRSNMQNIEDDNLKLLPHDGETRVAAKKP